MSLFNDNTTYKCVRGTEGMICFVGFKVGFDDRFNGL
jgi:hypothetical protein